MGRWIQKPISSSSQFYFENSPEQIKGSKSYLNRTSTILLVKGSLIQVCPRDEFVICRLGAV